MRKWIALSSALLVAAAFSSGSAHAEENSNGAAQSGVLQIPEQRIQGAEKEKSAITDASSSCSHIAKGRELCLSAAEPSETGNTYWAGGGRAARKSASGDADAGQVAANELVCSTGQLNYTYDRFNSCLGSYPVNITELKEGKPVGTANMEVTAQMNLDPDGLTWKENIKIKYVKFTGNLTTTTFGVSFTANCNRSCSMVNASPWAGEQRIIPEQTISGDVTFGVGTPNSGFNGGITTNYKINISQSGTIPVQPNTSWSNPQKIRCDNEVGGTAGCVYSHVKPNLELPLSQYGEAAATYLFQQQYSNYAWGTEQEPLHRLADEAAQQANRDSTCVVAAEGAVDTPELFVRKTSRIPEDSCDEYPFAASVEGGTPGEFCNDVEFELVDGKWIYDNANPSKPWTQEANCTRGHVPFDLNRNAGGALGRLVQSERIIDFDAYTVTVTE
ncbi:hypothetical protein [Streptomyces sp. MMBL 11-3]|uniref:hypothetical protein n=1 Tax=Streptomyces sp. MMBL 11-3 TaxID=3382639 RepID=UPI0039B6C5A5